VINVVGSGWDGMLSRRSVKSGMRRLCRWIGSSRRGLDGSGKTLTRQAQVAQAIAAGSATASGTDVMSLPDLWRVDAQENFAGCSGVIIDWCKPHGYWFDRTELQKVVSFVRSGGMQKAREKERMLLREEQERLRDLQSQPLPGSVDPRVDSASEFWGIDTDFVETIAEIIKKLFA